MLNHGTQQNVILRLIRLGQKNPCSGLIVPTTLSLHSRPHILAQERQLFHISTCPYFTASLPLHACMVIMPENYRISFIATLPPLRVNLARKRICACLRPDNATGIACALIAPSQQCHCMQASIKPSLNSSGSTFEIIVSQCFSS